MEEIIERIIRKVMAEELADLKAILEESKEDQYELLTRLEAAAYLKMKPRTFDSKKFKKTYLADGLTFRYRKVDLLREPEPQVKQRATRKKRGIKFRNQFDQ